MRKRRFFKQFFSVLFLLLVFALVSCVPNEQDQKSTVHVLMPVYNAEKFITLAIKSVAVQNHSNWKMLILDDGSTDNSVEKIKQFIDSHPDLKEKIHLQLGVKNVGVSKARTRLIKWSKELNKEAYILWLDADNKFNDSSFIQRVIKQMQKTQADICIFNFSIIYDDENQKDNAIGLVKEKEMLAEIIEMIRSAPMQTVNPLELPNPMDISSIDWVKCYAPNVEFPVPKDCPFENFVTMAMLLDAKKITALPAEYEPIQYLRRSTSICGQRDPKHFTNDILVQLQHYFDTVWNNNQNSKDLAKKAKMSKEFILRKLAQYRQTLEKIVEAKSHTDIDKKIIKIYQEKARILEAYISAKVAS